jgi:hypothetical protein
LAKEAVEVEAPYRIRGSDEAQVVTRLVELS